MKILYVTTVSSTMSFFPEHFKMLMRDGHTIELACNCASPVRQDIADMGFIIHDIPFSRSPLSKDNIRACKQLKALVREGNYDIVHCHTPNAAAITRLVCRGFRKNGLRVFYTAHGFHFYKGAPLKNWLLYYPVEWLCAHWTDVLITINQEDYALAQKRMKAKKVRYVPGVGYDTRKFQSPDVDRAEKRRELGIPDGALTLISVGELNQNKNHETVIRAIADMTDVYYIIAGQGGLASYLQELIKELGLGGRVKLLGFRTDIAELCAAADIFVFPSFREGLSVALMEAMASGLPVVCSRIRGNTDLIDENGGCLFDPHSVRKCREAIQTMLARDFASMGNYNRGKVKAFSTENVLREMEKIYR